MDLRNSTGTRRLVPVFLFFALAAGGLVAGLDTASARPEDPFAEDGEEKRELTLFEKAAKRVVGRIRGDEAYPATLEAVELMLREYAETGHAEDRARAESLARSLQGAGDMGSPRPLYLVAQAGGGTLAEAEAAMEVRRLAMQQASRASAGTLADFVQDLFARAAARRDGDSFLAALVATGEFMGTMTTQQGSRLVLLPGGDGAETATLSDYVEAVRSAALAAEGAGVGRLRDDAGRLAHEMIQTYWDDDETRFRLTPIDRAGMPEVVELLLNARAAMALHAAGQQTGDRLLLGRAERVLNSILDEALAEPLAAPAAALAGARIGEHPVQMVLVGNPADPVIMELREASFVLFEPRRMLLTLDPAVDRARLEEMGYPADLGPVLFICVDLICSAPIQTADGLEDHVAEILRLAREAEH